METCSLLPRQIKQQNFLTLRLGRSFIRDLPPMMVRPLNNDFNDIFFFNRQDMPHQWASYSRHSLFQF